ncbi:PREDICTED: transcription initiation factor TFIID subunit 8-like [Camelina sativa]|uniref:Transcription initiation factor TFIID subunit 8-like n=1 Tax=Camelina sativa TaxID=90675 RepID=A0ABM0VTN1_CAMSA|nr:PREDICTED: transcription initiation factor TFIID subunit 8-like [Camelina sativa]
MRRRFEPHDLGFFLINPIFTNSNTPPCFSILSKISTLPMKRRRNSKLKLEEPSDQSPTTTADFTFTLTRIAVSQICQSIGYKATDSSALNTLTVTTTKFLQSLAGLASSFSNAANRTESNLFDIVNGLQDIALSTSDCFPGGSTVHDVESHCLIKSAVLRNLSDFVKYAPEIPFAKPLPKPERDIGSSSGKDLDHAAVAVTQSVEYVPAWLPPFPDASLYSDRCTKDGSDHLWEYSDSVIDRENLKSESCRGKKGGGRLPQRRARVRFKMGRRFERWHRDNDGESGRDIEVKKNIFTVPASGRFKYIH